MIALKDTKQLQELYYVSSDVITNQSVPFRDYSPFTWSFPQ